MVDTHLWVPSSQAHAAGGVDPSSRPGRRRRSTDGRGRPTRTDGAAAGRRWRTEPPRSAGAM